MLGASRLDRLAVRLLLLPCTLLDRAFHHPPTDYRELLDLCSKTVKSIICRRLSTSYRWASTDYRRARTRDTTETFRSRDLCRIVEHVISVTCRVTTVRCRP